MDYFLIVSLLLIILRTNQKNDEIFDFFHVGGGFGRSSVVRSLQVWLRREAPHLHHQRRLGHSQRRRLGNKTLYILHICIFVYFINFLFFQTRNTFFQFVQLTPPECPTNNDLLTTPDQFFTNLQFLSTNCCSTASTNPKIKCLLPLNTGKLFKFYIDIRYTIKNK